MKKIRLGIYIEDSEYGDRLTCYFMNHYKDQLEIHMYTMKEQLEHLEGEIDIMLSSELDQWNNKYIPLIQIVEETPIESEEGIYFVEKYQEVNRIVEEILKHVGGEVRDLTSEGSLIGQTRLISVYSLADNQYQIVDTRLSDGSRVNIVLNPISIGGSAISIRKFPEHPMSMERLIEIEALSPEVARLLQILTQAKYNIFISGGTGSGKTTFLNALSQYIPDDERIITIEDSAELQLLGAKNIVRLETRNANTDGVTPITIRDLIRTALRMRPDRIIVGECRGAEALDMLQAIICTI